MKKWSIFILAFLFALTGCAKEETENQILSSTSFNAISLDEAIEKSEFAIIGTYTDVTTFDEYVYFNFDVNEVLYGELNEATVSVYARMDRHERCLYRGPILCSPFASERSVNL